VEASSGGIWIEKHDKGIRSREFQRPTQEVPYYPSFNIRHRGNPIAIHIPRSNNLFISLYEAKLYSKAKVTTAEGKALASEDSVALTNNFFREAFSKCKVALNSLVVSKSARLFPYRGHMLDNLTRWKAYETQQRLSLASSPHCLYNNKRIITYI